MKVSLLSVDENLIAGVKSSFDSVKTIQNMKDIETSTDVLILTDRFLEYTDIVEYDFTSHDYVFYVMQQEIIPVLERTVQGICEGNNIHYLSGRLTNEQVVHEIMQAITPQEIETNHVYSFFSSVSNVGTTSTSLSTAYALSENSKAKVGVLMLNAWDSGADYLKYSGHYLDEIKSNLFNKMYESNDTFQELFQEVKKDSLYVLLGNRNMKLERLYTKEEINRLIERAKQIFDIVLIDAGSHFDNANIVQALYSSDYHLLVLNQQEKAKRKFEDAYKDILTPLGFQREQFMLVINQYKDNAYLPKIKDLKAALSIPVLTAIEDSKNGYMAEMENKSLYLFEDIKYQEGINVIARAIASQSNIEFEESIKRKKLFSFS